MVEQLTRLAPYIPFLQQNQQIKIHVESKTGFIADILKHVGLHPSRLIGGHVKAKVRCTEYPYSENSHITEELG